MDMYALLYLKWITNKDLWYSTGNSAQCYVAGWVQGESGGEGIHVYVWLSLFAVHLKLSQHCSLVILQCKINRFLKKWCRESDQDSRAGRTELLSSHEHIKITTIYKAAIDENDLRTTRKYMGSQRVGHD